MPPPCSPSRWSRPRLLKARRSSVVEGFTVDHPAHPCDRRGSFTGRAGPGGGIQHAAVETKSTQAPLCIAYRLTLGMRRGVIAQHHTARALARECAAEHQHRPIRLVAPGHGELLHREGRFVPARLRWRGLGWAGGDAPCALRHRSAPGVHQCGQANQRTQQQAATRHFGPRDACWIAAFAGRGSREVPGYSAGNCHIV